ncbi:HPP family protein [Candidatus Omnitrophota bacterium]
MNQNQCTLDEFMLIPLKDIMVTKPFTIGVDEPFSRVWDIFKIHSIRHLPVLNDERKLEGIITQRDLYKIISPRKTTDGNFVYDKAELDQFILKHVMKKDVVALSPSDTLGHLVDVMVRKKYGCIPVIDETRYLAGIMTQIDVLRILADPVSKIKRQIH